MKRQKDTRLVYSTEQGKICPACEHPVGQCRCKGQKNTPPSDGIVRVSRQAKGRKGKGVTLITGIPLEQSALKEFAKKLRKKCGTGGTVKDMVVEIQGDQRNRIMEELKGCGWQVKLSGG